MAAFLLRNSGKINHELRVDKESLTASQHRPKVTSYYHYSTHVHSCSCFLSISRGLMIKQIGFLRVPPLILLRKMSDFSLFWLAVFELNLLLFLLLKNFLVHSYAASFSIKLKVIFCKTKIIFCSQDNQK